MSRTHPNIFRSGLPGARARWLPFALGVMLAGTCALTVTQPASGRLAGSSRALRATSSRALQATRLTTGIEAAINHVRVRYQRRRLTFSAGLGSAAAAHSFEMTTLGYFAHASANGEPMWSRVRAYFPERGFRVWEVGENLVWLSPTATATEVIRRWLASPEHRANLLDPSWAQVGCAAVHAPSAPNAFSNLPVTVVTCDFGLRRP